MGRLIGAIGEPGAGGHDDTEHAEVVRRGVRRHHRRGAIAEVGSVGRGLPGGHVGEDVTLAAEVLDVEIRERDRCDLTARSTHGGRGQAREPGRVLYSGRGTPGIGVQRREQAGVGADAERNHPDDHARKQWRS